MKVQSIALVMILGMAPIVHASSVDFVRTDNYTTDLLSGLDWLDINASAGRSYSDVSKDINLTSAGWHYASVNQLNQMVKDYTGISVDLSTSNQIPSTAAGNLSVVTGYTGSRLYGEQVLIPGYGYRWNDKLALLTSGMTGDIDAKAPFSHKAIQFESRPFDAALLWLPFSNSDTNAQTYIGSFLIRNSQSPAAVPLPSSILVFIMAILGWKVLRLQRCESSLKFF